MKPSLILLFVAFISLSFVAIAQTNAVAPPADSKIDTWLTNAQNILTAVASIVAVIMGIIAKVKSNQASVIEPMIKSIESFGSNALKNQIEARATAEGVEDRLGKLVEKHTKEP